MSIALPRDGGGGLGPRPWLPFYPQEVPASLEYPNEPVWWLLDRAARHFPDRIATHYYGHTLSYAQLEQRARQAASLFARAGIQPGDRVGLLLPNTPEYLVASYGAWMAGGVVVSINPLSAPAEVARLVESTRCRLVVCLDLLRPLLRKAEGIDHVYLTTIQDRLNLWQRWAYRLARWQRNRKTRDATATVGCFNAEVEQREPRAQPIQVDGDAAAYILPTGGTTGASKSVVLTHANLIANAWQLTHWTGQSFGEDSLLAIAPFFHSYGLSTCATTGVASATTMILHHRFDARMVAQLIEKYRPTCFPAVPMMLHEINAQFRRRGRRSPLPLVQYCVSGGAPLPPEVGREFAEHTGALVVEGFGLSEASPVTHVGPLDGSTVKGAIGLPLPDTDARIVDRNSGTAFLPIGQVGELVVRGPQVMRGYFENEAQTGHALRDGWLHTGDLARQHPDGSFEIVDRMKDLIITSGANVYPTEVEEVLRAAPGVLEAAVIGVPDARRGEVVKAFLRVAKRARFDRRTFDQFVEERLAKFKRPRLVELVETELPVNFLGKVIRRELR